MENRLFTIIFLSLILCSLFVLADEPTINVEEGEVKDIKDKIDQIPIDPETGEFDPNRLNKSIAEERVEKINNWIEENAEWLKLIFCMVPEISWLFAFVLYFWMLFFVLFVLNGEIFMFFNFVFIGDDNQSSQAEKYARLIGIGSFVILVALKIIYHIGNFFYMQWYIVWNYLLPLGIIAIAVGIIILVVLMILSPKLILVLTRWIKKKKEAKSEEQKGLDREILHTEVKAMQGGK